MPTYRCRTRLHFSRMTFHLHVGAYGLWQQMLESARHAIFIYETYIQHPELARWSRTLHVHLSSRMDLNNFLTLLLGMLATLFAIVTLLWKCRPCRSKYHAPLNDGTFCRPTDTSFKDCSVLVIISIRRYCLCTNHRCIVERSLCTISRPTLMRVGDAFDARHNLVWLSNRRRQLLDVNAGCMRRWINVTMIGRNVEKVTRALRLIWRGRDCCVRSSFGFFEYSIC